MYVFFFQISQDAYKKATEVWVDLLQELYESENVDEFEFRQLLRLYWASHQVISLS
jgi:hypothetical protein